MILHVYIFNSNSGTFQTPIFFVCTTKTTSNGACEYNHSFMEMNSFLPKSTNL
jgi:hypothetical protein